MYNKRFDLNSSHHQCKVSNNTFKTKVTTVKLRHSTLHTITYKPK